MNPTIFLNFKIKFKIIFFLVNIYKLPHIVVKIYNKFLYKLYFSHLHFIWFKLNSQHPLLTGLKGDRIYFKFSKNHNFWGIHKSFSPDFSLK